LKNRKESFVSVILFFGLFIRFIFYIVVFVVSHGEFTPCKVFLRRFIAIRTHQGRASADGRTYHRRRDGFIYLSDFKEGLAGVINVERVFLPVI
jgi:hypothetical protein